MDASASMLNDSAKELYTYAKQLPHLRRANEFLENLLISCGVSIQRRGGVTITVVAAPGPIDLSNIVGYPSDMLLPINVLGRRDSSDVWIPITETAWEPDIPATSSIDFWSFHDGVIFIPGVTASRELKINYWRQLSAIVSEGSNEEISGSKTYLEAKTAELCARYIGQNREIADDLLNIEVAPAQDLLEGIYIKNTQGTRARRMRFKRPRGN